MQTYGTALTDGQLAEFLGNGTRALALIASKLGPQRANYWSGKSQKMQERLLKALTPLLLKPLGTVDIAATTGQLVVRDEFAVGKNGITYVGENFSQWFFPMVESPALAAQLCYWKLLEASVDEPIMGELGSSKEATLGHVLFLIRKQKGGKSGVLLTNGYANIFYVRDISGTLRAVSVLWLGVGWHVYALSVSYPFGWRHESRVFSRNS